jgi:hypothetical protein
VSNFWAAELNIDEEMKVIAVLLGALICVLQFLHQFDDKFKV